MDPSLIPRPDRPTVDAEGRELVRRIDGVVVRPAVTHFDERGELTEVFSLAWGVLPEPVVHVYQVIATPGSIRGWVVHQHQTDRLFFSLGRFRIVLYDDRAGSPTHGQVDEIYAGERCRALLTIPAGVFHAIQNLGTTDAIFLNLPTRAYDHAVPDKLRLPLDSERIPYRFDSIGPHRAPAAT
jgi:dTDP-4-dehydrorhamnose 3,5-epimerase